MIQELVAGLRAIRKKREEARLEKDRRGRLEWELKNPGYQTVTDPKKLKPPR